ncbi:MAG: glycoside hydrolase family 9 protein [Opitutaceae bacterium]|nr:glycoside hydrolase family 9 protein [Cytophagales bacterium]
MKQLLTIGLGSMIGFQCFAQNVLERIKLNQVGFYPKGEKIAIIEGATASNNFYLLSNDQIPDTVFRGKLSAKAVWDYSNENVRKADFSSFTEKGEYVLFVPEIGKSYTFKIDGNVNDLSAKAALKAFYYQRASIDIPVNFGGKWARKGGHPDNGVIIHNSAQTILKKDSLQKFKDGTAKKINPPQKIISGKYKPAEPRKAGDLIPSPGGWYDAGDYNKYIVNSGISMYTLLSIVEDFPFHTDTLKLNIPESGNNVPDLLDEILWNLRWMLTMQDPYDGGVYHKLTNPVFDGSVMPQFATKPRYVVKKTTSAAYDFAAVTAQASRILTKHRRTLPGLADSCLRASIAAYNWAKKNPEAAYIQSEMSDPGISTGAYDDFNFRDEKLWASVELFVTTGKMEFYENSGLELALSSPFRLPDWQNVATLGLYTLSKNAGKLKGDAKYEDIPLEGVKKQILKYANRLREHKKSSAYGIAMGTETSDFVWGSNAVCANQGMLLIQAFLLTDDKSYLETANANLDYILGRNGTGYSFETGFGSKSARNPHQRLSEADGVEEPIPGFMVGGPNPGQEDKGSCAAKPYPSSLPALSYIDHKCSYASNEIAINWQAAFAYLINGVEILRIGNYEEIEK